MSETEKLINLHDTLVSVLTISQETEVYDESHEQLANLTYANIEREYGIVVSNESLLATVGLTAAAVGVSMLIGLGTSAIAGMFSGPDFSKSASWRHKNYTPPTPKPKTAAEQQTNNQMAYQQNYQQQTQQTKYTFGQPQQPTGPSPEEIVKLKAVRKLNMASFYGGRLTFETADSVVKEMLRLIHFSRDLVSKFPLQDVLESHSRGSVFMDKYAVTWNSFNESDFLGEKIFRPMKVENGNVFMMRISNTNKARHLYEDLNKKMLKEYVSLDVKNPLDVLSSVDKIINIEIPALVRTVVELETILKPYFKASKFEDSDFRFDDGMPDTTLMQIWESYRHIAAVLSTMISHNAQAIKTALVATSKYGF